MKEVTIEEFMKRFMKQCENLQETADELYIKGFDNGKEHGRDEAWGCAKMIDRMSCTKLEEIFGTYDFSDVIQGTTAEEAMQKIKDYEKRKNDNFYMHIYGQTLEEMKEDRGKWKLSNSTATECENTEAIPPIEHKCDTCQKFGDECDGHAFGCKDYEAIECEILNDKCISPNKECYECPVCQKYELTKKKCNTCYYNTTEYSVCQNCNNGDLYSERNKSYQDFQMDEEFEELDFVQEYPTIPITITAMRDATPEELKGVYDYIKSISTKTGVNFYDNL